MSNYLTTIASSYRLARNETESADTVIDLTTGGYYSNRPSAGIVDLCSTLTNETKANGIYFIFCGGTAADMTFSYRLLAWKNSNGPAEIACEGDGVLGTQAVVYYPASESGAHNSVAATNRFWADTINIDNDDVFLKRFKAANSTDSVAKLWTDDCGYRFWRMELYDIHGGGNQASAITVYWSYW